MNNKTYYSFLLLSTVVLLSCKNDKESIQAKFSPLTEAVYSSVTIQPVGKYEVYASVNGILESINVEEGDLVNRGQILFKIKNTTPELNVQNSKVALAQARQHASRNSTILGGIQDEIKNAQLNLKNAKRNYERQKKLWQQDIGTRTEFDARKLAYESAQNQLNMLRGKYDRSKTELNTALKQASIQYKSASSNATDFTVTSRIKGSVYAINKEQGEIISPQIPLAMLGDANDFIIEMLIDEVDITKIQTGQKVLITLDAYDKQVFEANISKIYPAKNERTQTFTVEGLFIENPVKLYPGLTGEANIIIAEKGKTLSLPREYINEQKQVNTPNGLVKVKTGLQSMDRVEILSGIDSSTQILKHEE